MPYAICVDFFRFSALEILRLLRSPLLTVDADPLEILLQNTVHVSDIDAHLSQLVRNFLATLFLWVIIYFNLFFPYLEMHNFNCKTTFPSENQKLYMYQQCYFFQIFSEKCIYI